MTRADRDHPGVIAIGRGLRWACVGWIVFASLASTGLAAGPAPEMLLFEEIVTSAAKHPQPAREAPSQTTVVTAADIRRYGYRTLADILRAQRGFYGSNDRNYEYVGVRGFLRPGDYNDRILLLVNNHAYNDDVYQQALLGNDFGIDLESIERVEIIRGPGGALYGGNALFAVINVVTATGADRIGVESVVETGSFGRVRVQLGAGHMFANGLNVYASFSSLQQDGDEHIYFPDFDTPESNNGIAADLDDEQAYNSFAIAEWAGWRLQAGANRRTKDVPTAPYGTVFNQPDNDTIDERDFIELRYDGSLLENLDVTARAFGDRVYFRGRYPTDVDGELVANRDYTESYWGGAEVSTRWAWHDLSLLTVGTEFSRHPDARQQNYDIDGETYLDDSRSYTRVGVYLQEELRLPWGVSLVGGARFDRYYHDINQASPRGAVIWLPRDDTTVKLLFGQAYRPPNLYELFYDVDSATGSESNPNLDSERITTEEIVVEYEFRPQVRVITATYHYKIHDLIDLKSDGDLLRYDNIGSARAYGTELGIYATLPAGVSWRSNYTFQHAVGPGGHKLSNSPRHLCVVGLASPELYGMNAAVELRVVGPRQTLAGENLETNVFGSLNVQYQTPVPRLSLTAAIYNLFDQRYSDPAGREHTQDSIPQDQLTFRLQARYGF